MPENQLTIRFRRSRRFPLGVNSDAVEAAYVNGVLGLNVPKVEVVKPKQIKVTGNG